MDYERFINLGVRLLSVGGKFTLLTYYAIKGNDFIVSNLGIYFIVIPLLTTVFGFELYAYTNRRYLRKPNSKRAKELIKIHSSQIIFVILLSTISLIVFHKIFSYQYLILLLIFNIELTLIEFNRILIIKGKQILATLLLFFRHGIWCYLPVLYSIISGKTVGLNDILLYWLISILIVYIFMLKYIFKYVGYLKEFFIVDIKVSKVFDIIWKLAIISIFYRSLISMDRVLTKYFFEQIVHSHYIYMCVLSTSIILIADPLIFSYTLPNLSKKINKINDKLGLQKFIQRDNKRILTLSIFWFISINLFFFVFSQFLNPAFNNYHLSFMILSLSGIFHMIFLHKRILIYLYNYDIFILKKIIISCMLFLLIFSIIIIIDKMTIFHVSMSMLIVNLFLFYSFYCKQNKILS